MRHPEISPLLRTCRSSLPIFVILAVAISFATPAPAANPFGKAFRAVGGLFGSEQAGPNTSSVRRPTERKRRASISFEGDEKHLNAKPAAAEPAEAVAPSQPAAPVITAKVPEFPALAVASSSSALQWKALEASVIADSHVGALRASDAALWVERRNAPIAAWIRQEDRFVSLGLPEFSGCAPVLLLGDDKGCWLAVGNGRVMRLSVLSETATVYTLPAPLRARAVDSAAFFAGRYWFKCRGDLAVFDPAKNEWQQGPPVGASSRATSGPPAEFAATLQAEGRLRAGGQCLLVVAPRVVAALSPNGELRILPEAATGDGESPAVSEAAAVDGHVALATRGGGILVAADPDGNTPFQRIKRFQPASLWETFNDGRGRRSREDDLTAAVAAPDGMWFAAAFGRILHYRPDTGALRVYARVYPTPSGRATCIARQGPWVWLGSTAGLQRVPAGDFEIASPRHPLEKGQWLRYEPSQRMPSLHDRDQLRLYAEFCRELGRPYVRGGEGKSGFDCSGFAVGVLRRFGLNLPHRSTLIHDEPVGTHEIHDLQFGDLLFFYTKGTSIFHTGLYLGEGRFIHSYSGANGVTVSSLADTYFPLTGVKRINLPGGSAPASPSFAEAAEPRIYLASASLAPPGEAAERERPLTDPLLRARPESLRAEPSVKPFDLAVRQASGGSRSFVLRLPAASPFVFNRRIMVLAVSGKAGAEAVSRKFRGSVPRRTLLVDRADLAGVGCEGPGFEGAQQGGVFLVSAEWDDSVAGGGYRSEFRFGPVEGDVRLYAVSLTGPGMGCLQALSF